MIKKIIQSDICAGCGLCESVIGKEKIKVELNNEGFYRPTELQKLSKAENDFFENSCPAVINKSILPDDSKKDKK